MKPEVRRRTEVTPRQAADCLPYAAVVSAAVVIVTHVRLVGTGHEHISEVRWWNPQTGQMGTSTRQVMVDWIQNSNGVARVTDGFRLVDVMVANANPPYIRTFADGQWTDNLLALPRF